MKKEISLLLILLVSPAMIFAIGFDAEYVKEGHAQEINVFDGVSIFAFSDYEETEKKENALQLSGPQGIINLTYLPNTDEWEIGKIKDKFVDALDVYYRELEVPYRKQISVFSFSAVSEDEPDRKAYLIRSFGKDWKAFLSYLLVDLGDRTLMVQALGGSDIPKEGGRKFLMTEQSMLGLRLEGYHRIEYVSGRFFAEKSGKNKIIDPADADNPDNPPGNSKKQLDD